MNELDIDGERLRGIAGTYVRCSRERESGEQGDCGDERYTLDGFGGE
jgi:hypothetical protein